MKKLTLLLITLLLCSNIHAQDNRIHVIHNTENGVLRDLYIPLNDNNKVEYSQVVTMKNKTAKEIYNASKIALTSFWNSYKDVSQLDDSEMNMIISKGWTGWTKSPDNLVSIAMNVQMSIKVECRDGRYRISVYDFGSFLHTPYGNVDINQEDATEHGIKKNRRIKESNLNGLSWLAWDQSAKKAISTIQQLIKSAHKTTEESW